MQIEELEVSTGPRIGVVMPVYGHSGLVVDALSSLSNQEGDRSFVLAFVNDGCPLAETNIIGESLWTWSDIPLSHYIHRSNGGLSAARNSGIDFLLRRYPSIEAVYLLDADNFLENHAMIRMSRALDEFPDDDWFYPDIEMFGLQATSSYAGDYSRLLHTMANLCEAGSLIRRRVFEGDVKFDESMRQGYEDWEFWLSAQEAGFVGRHVPGLGFRYRKRPESMLADSFRDDSDIKSYIRRKHKKVFSLRNLISYETNELPRYALCTEKDNVLLCTDPRSPIRSLNRSKFEETFWSWSLCPEWKHSPPFIVYVRDEALQVLSASGVLIWALWDLESRLRDSQIVSTRLEYGRGLLRSISGETRRLNEALAECHMIMLAGELARSVVLDTDARWWEGTLFGTSSIRSSTRVLSVPDPRVDHQAPDAALGMFQLIFDLRKSRYRQSRDIKWKWTTSGVPDRHKAYTAAREAVNGGVVYPYSPDNKTQIVFILSHADFGGVEKVAFNVAAEAKRRGYVPHLALFGQGNIVLPRHVTDVFETFMWVTADGLLNWNGESYNGTRLSRWSQFGDKSQVTGMLGVFDVVVNCQSGDAHGVIGELKRRGAITVTHQHLIEYSPLGRPGGSGVLAKAFEHSYDLVLTCSQQLKDWFIGNGVPSQKLVPLENAPSYSLSQTSDDILKTRSERTGTELRVLFIGRLDAQKGLDRLLKIIETLSSEAGIAWRIVGKAIVDRDPSIDKLSKLVRIEEPVYEADQLTSRLLWADVVILPSRFEGVPLIALEAMQCGAVVVACDVGAIAEVVNDQVDGYLVPQQGCVVAMINILKRLQADPLLLATLSKNALAANSKRSWTSNSDDFFAALQAVQQRRAERQLQ